MNKFLLYCDVVSTRADDLVGVANELNDLSNTISSYDTSDSEEFNFSGAVKAIANNVIKASEKINNSAKLLKNVVDLHSQIQSNYSSSAYFNTIFSIGGIDSNNTNNNVNSYKEISIPSSVKQLGISKNHTNYSEFYYKWDPGTDQRILADKWASLGKPNERGIATMDGRYMVAVAPKFGKVGDKIDVVLEDNNIIKALVGDEKGPDATSEYGHDVDGFGIDIIEWESYGEKENIDISGWEGLKVSKIINKSSQ